MRGIVLVAVLLVLSACSPDLTKLSVDAENEFNQVELRLALVGAAKENIDNNLKEFGDNSTMWDEQERYTIAQGVDLYNEAVGKYNATCLSYMEKRSGVWKSVPDSAEAPLSCQTK